MPRPLRSVVGDTVYHVFNRANARMTIFEAAGDYDAFERIMAEACQRIPMRIVSYVVMPNHWHFVLWPLGDRDLSAFMYWLSLTHAQRWHAAHGTVGTGHLYQGRFKSFPVQSDKHLLTVCRYIERNPLAAGLVAHSEEWKWGSLWRRTHGDASSKALLSDWPVDRPDNWSALVNRPQSEKEVAAIEQCLQRGRPFGNDAWVESASRRLGLESTLHVRGRPKKGSGPFLT